MKLEKHIEVKISLNKIINQKLSKFNFQKIKIHSLVDKKKHIYQNLENLISKYNSLPIIIHKQKIKKKFIRKKILRYESKLKIENDKLEESISTANKQKKLYLKKKNQENLEMQQKILVLEGNYLNLDNEMSMEIEENNKKNQNQINDNNINISELNYKLKMKKYNNLEKENIKHSLEILKEENKYIVEEQEIKIREIRNKYINLKKEIDLKREIKISELEENKKLELEQFEVFNHKVKEIKDYIKYLRNKKFGVKLEIDSNQKIIKKRKNIKFQINQEIKNLKRDIKKEEKLKKYLNHKYLNYNTKILNINKDMIWKQEKIDLVDMIKSILDKNPKIKREVRMYKILI